MMARLFISAESRTFLDDLVVGVCRPIFNIIVD